MEEHKLQSPKLRLCCPLPPAQWTIHNILVNGKVHVADPCIRGESKQKYRNILFGLEKKN
jgi:hypothetical protein